MQGKQCPSCGRHRHEEWYVEKRCRKWLIDRCAFSECHYNFEIEEYTGPSSHFYSQLRRQNNANA